MKHMKQTSKQESVITADGIDHVNQHDDRIDSAGDRNFYA